MEDQFMENAPKSKQMKSRVVCKGISPQGDPLSPYLFLIVSEVLSRNITSACNRGTLVGIKISRFCPGISHLMFADDTLFFLQAEVGNCMNLAAILKKYCCASGQCINFDKSSLYFSSNTPVELKATIGKVFDVPLENKPGNYLGLPTHWGRSKREALAYIRDRIKSKIEGWTAKFLNQAGKETLIKAVATAVPSYPMSIFAIPKTLCTALNSDLANFWWSKDDSSRGIHWIAWEKLCEGKEQGGIGFRDLEAYNLSLLSKQAWRILKNPNAFWVRILKAKYFPYCSFLDAGVGSKSTWGWNSLLRGRDIIKQNAKWQICNGQLVDVWKDSWVPNLISNNGIITPKVPDANTSPMKVSSLIDQVNLTWKLDHILPSIDEKDIRAIKSIPLHNLEEDDRLIWPHNKDGVFTVKSGYRCILASKKGSITEFSSNSSRPTTPRWKYFWRFKTLPKVRIFVWKAIKNVIPTMENLFRRNISKLKGCSFCGEEVESTEHCLIYCPWARAVWFGCALGICPQNEVFSPLEEWLFNLWNDLPDNKRRDWCAAYSSIIIWEIWKHRCDALYSGKPLNPERVIWRSNCLMQEIENLNLEEALEVTQDTNMHWQPPSPNHYKLNFDASWNQWNLDATAGIVVRDHSGNIICGKTFWFKANTVIEAEANGLIKGLEEAIVHGLKNLQVEGDNQDLMNAVNGSVDKSHWAIYPSLFHIRSLKNHFDSVSWRWIKREANRLADAASRLAKEELSPMDWTLSPPAPILAVICYEGHSGPP